MKNPTEKTKNYTKHKKQKTLQLKKKPSSNRLKKILISLTSLLQFSLTDIPTWKSPTITKAITINDDIQYNLFDSTNGDAQNFSMSPNQEKKSIITPRFKELNKPPQSTSKDIFQKIEKFSKNSTFVLLDQRNNLIKILDFNSFYDKIIDFDYHLKQFGNLKDHNCVDFTLLEDYLFLLCYKQNDISFNTIIAVLKFEENSLEFLNFENFDINKNYNFETIDIGIEFTGKVEDQENVIFAWYNDRIKMADILTTKFTKNGQSLTKIVNYETGVNIEIQGSSKKIIKVMKIFNTLTAIVTDSDVPKEEFQNFSLTFQNLTNQENFLIFENPLKFELLTKNPDFLTFFTFNFSDLVYPTSEYSSASTIIGILTDNSINFIASNGDTIDFFLKKTLNKISLTNFNFFSTSKNLYIFLQNDNGESEIIQVRSTYHTDYIEAHYYRQGMGKEYDFALIKEDPNNHFEDHIILFNAGNIDHVITQQPAFYYDIKNSEKKFFSEDFNKMKNSEKLKNTKILRKMQKLEKKNLQQEDQFFLFAEGDGVKTTSKNTFSLIDDIYSTINLDISPKKTIFTRTISFIKPTPTTFRGNLPSYDLLYNTRTLKINVLNFDPIGYFRQIEPSEEFELKSAKILGEKYLTLFDDKKNLLLLYEIKEILDSPGLDFISLLSIRTEGNIVDMSIFQNTIFIAEKWTDQNLKIKLSYYNIYNRSQFDEKIYENFVEINDLKLTKYGLMDSYGYVTLTVMILGALNQGGISKLYTGTFTVIPKPSLPEYFDLFSYFLNYDFETILDFNFIRYSLGTKISILTNIAKKTEFLQESNRYYEFLIRGGARAYFNLEKYVKMNLTKPCKIETTSFVSHILCGNSIYSVNARTGDISIFDLLDKNLNISQVLDTTSNEIILQLLVNDDKGVRKILNLRGDEENDPCTRYHSFEQIGENSTQIHIGKVNKKSKVSYSVCYNTEENFFSVKKVQTNGPVLMVDTRKCPGGEFNIKMVMKSFDKTVELERDLQLEIMNPRLSTDLTLKNEKVTPSVNGSYLLDDIVDFNGPVISAEIQDLSSDFHEFLKEIKDSGVKIGAISVQNRFNITGILARESNYYQNFDINGGTLIGFTGDYFQILNFDEDKREFELVLSKRMTPILDNFFEILSPALLKTEFYVLKTTYFDARKIIFLWYPASEKKIKNDEIKNSFIFMNFTAEKVNTFITKSPKDDKLYAILVAFDTSTNELIFKKGELLNNIEIVPKIEIYKLEGNATKNTNLVLSDEFFMTLTIFENQNSTAFFFSDSELFVKSTYENPFPDSVNPDYFEVLNIECEEVQTFSVYCVFITDSVYSYIILYEINKKLEETGPLIKNKILLRKFENLNNFDVDQIELNSDYFGLVLRNSDRFDYDTNGIMEEEVVIQVYNYKNDTYPLITLTPDKLGIKNNQENTEFLNLKFLKNPPKMSKNNIFLALGSTSTIYGSSIISVGVTPLNLTFYNNDPKSKLKSIYLKIRDYEGFSKYPLDIIFSPKKDPFDDDTSSYDIWIMFFLLGLILGMLPLIIYMGRKVCKNSGSETRKTFSSSFMDNGGFTTGFVNEDKEIIEEEEEEKSFRTMLTPPDAGNSSGEFGTPDMKAVRRMEEEGFKLE